MVEIDYHKNIDIIRERYEKLIRIPTEKRDSHNLFELMRLTANMSIFQELKMTKIHENLCKFLKEKSFEKGEVIFKQGDEGDCFYFILSGAVDLYVFDIEQNTGKTILNLNKNCYPGEGFGELSVIYDCPRSFTAIAAIKTSVIYMRKKIYRQYVKDFHEKELFEFIKFLYLIPIFKDQIMKNIIKFCLKSQKEKLNSYIPFIKYHDYLDRFIIIKTGVIKAFYKIKVTKNFMENSHSLTEEEFRKKLENLQKFEINSEVKFNEIIKKDFNRGNYLNLESKQKITSNTQKWKGKSKENSIGDNRKHTKRKFTNESDKDKNSEGITLSNTSNLNLIKNVKLAKLTTSKYIESISNVINETDENFENSQLTNKVENNQVTFDQMSKGKESNLTDSFDRMTENNEDEGEKFYSLNEMECNNEIPLDQIGKEDNREKTDDEKELFKINKFAKENLIFNEKIKYKGKDSVYNEIIEVMEFNEKDMVCEFYAAKSHKLDVFLLPILPTEIITIKIEDFREIFPDISNAIREYSRPIFENKRIFKKLYKTMKWKKYKKDLLSNVLKKEK